MSLTRILQAHFKDFTQRKKGTKPVPLGYCCYKQNPFFKWVLLLGKCTLRNETVPLDHWGTEILPHTGTQDLKEKK